MTCKLAQPQVHHWTSTYRLLPLPPTATLHVLPPRSTHMCHMSTLYRLYAHMYCPQVKLYGDVVVRYISGDVDSQPYLAGYDPVPLPPGFYDKPKPGQLGGACRSLNTSHAISRFGACRCGSWVSNLMIKLLRLKLRGSIRSCTPHAQSPCSQSPCSQSPCCAVNVRHALPQL